MLWKCYTDLKKLFINFKLQAILRGVIKPYTIMFQLRQDMTHTFL